MTDDQNLLIAAADGIEQFDEYLNILRQHVDDLESQGIAYEEQDRRAEPLTVSLLISIIVTAAVSTTVTELIKTIITKLSEKAKHDVSAPKVNIQIMETTFVLPQEMQGAVDAVDKLGAVK